MSDDDSTFRVRAENGPWVDVSRRGFLRYAGATGVAGGLSALLVACGGGGSPASSGGAEASGSSGGGSQSTASSGGGSASGGSAAASGGSPSGAASTTLTAAVSNSGGSDNTALEQLPTPWFNSGMLSQYLTYRGLFVADPDLTTVHPDLAEKSELSSDKLTLTITLKDGLKWSDGEPLTTDDVIWSMNTILKAAQANAIYINAFRQIEGADKVKAGSDVTITGLSASGNVITMKLSVPVGDMVPVLAQFMILPKHSLEKSDPLKMDKDPFWQKPVTSGMFKMGQLSPGNFYTLVPNSNYEGQKPHIKQVNVVGTADPVSDAKAGKIDTFYSSEIDVIQGMEKLKNFTSNPVEVLYYRYFIFNITEPDSPFKDIKSRQALTYAIDLKSLVPSLYPKIGVVINSGVPAGSPDHDSSIPDYTYNPDKAKSLLKAANFDFSQKVRLRYYYTDQTSINFMTAVAQQLADLGMQTDVQVFTGDATTALYTTKKWDVALKGLSAFGISEWYAELSNTPTFGQIIGPQPEFAELNKQLAEASEPSQIKSILMQLQKLAQQKLLKLPLYTLEQYVFMAKRVHGTGKFGNPLYLYDNKFVDWTLS